MPQARNSITQVKGRKFGLLTATLLFMSFCTSAQTIKLDFEPNKPILRFYFDSLTIYTDTTSLFLIYEKYGTKGQDGYHRRIKHYARSQFNASNSDTISFKDNPIPFNDNIDNNKWYVDWAIQNLTRKNYAKMYDRRGQLVTKIKTKRIGTKKKGRVRCAFINKDTNEELFAELIFLRRTHGRYRN